MKPSWNSTSHQLEQQPRIRTVISSRFPPRRGTVIRFRGAVLTVASGREAATSPGGTWAAVCLALLPLPQRLHSSFHSSALLSLWHWLSNTSRNTTGWLWPTLAVTNAFLCLWTLAHTYSHTYTLTGKMYLHSWSYTSTNFHTDVVKSLCVSSPLNQQVEQFLPAIWATAPPAGYCRTSVLMLFSTKTCNMVPLYVKALMDNWAWIMRRVSALWCYWFCLVMWGRWTQFQHTRQIFGFLMSQVHCSFLMKPFCIPSSTVSQAGMQNGLR